MITLNINYEVLPDRLVTIKLPESVSVGRHELVILLSEARNSGRINDFIKKRYESSLSEPLLDAEEIFAKMAARNAD